MPNFPYDVFISYSSKDKVWVRGELLSRIEQAGLKAFIDFRDFRAGAPSIVECERGVVECRKTLLVLTPHYIESEWGEMENVMLQTLSPANRDLRMIPLLKEACTKPLRIAALTHIDFTADADHALAWHKLLTSLGAQPGPQPPVQPPTPTPPTPQSPAPAPTPPSAPAPVPSAAPTSPPPSAQSTPPSASSSPAQPTAPPTQPPTQQDRSQWCLAHPYPMPPNFTGRVQERAMLNHWLNDDAAHPLLSLRALGGFGKSALTWHWLMYDVDPAQWPHVVWWSFYENDAGFDAFLTRTLQYLSGGTRDAAKLSASLAVETLLRLLHDPGTLLVLDGFERLLRAFEGLDAAYQGDEARPDARPHDHEHDHERDCISPFAESFLRYVALLPQLRSKVLLTTRLTPRVLEVRGGGWLHGAHEEELKQMQPADAVAFFHAQGIRGTHTEIEAACEPYGYHPLSLSLLAGLIMGDFAQPGEIAAAKRLDVSGDLLQRRHHVLQASYDSLSPTQKELLGRIACFRSPVSYHALQAIVTSEQTASAQSHDHPAAGDHSK